VNDADSMKKRTKAFALRVIRFTNALPRSPEAAVIGRQLLRSGTSVGANYRSACLARSRADFVAKLGVVAEEADESKYWLELLSESGVARADGLADLMGEAAEITSMIIASIKTARDSKRT
jgi:four helix bundle protein